MQLQENDDLDPRPNKDALIQQLGGPPRGGGIGSGMAAAAGAIPQAMTSMSAPPEASPVAAPQQPKSNVFQSDNKSLSGYLQEAASAYRPELIKHSGDAARKSAAEQYIRSLEPELRARGWQGGDIKNEKIQVDGRWMDLYQDVEGAANAQYADVTDSGQPQMGARMGGLQMAQGGMHPLLAGDALGNIQAALSQYSEPSSNLEALLAQLQGQ